MTPSRIRVEPALLRRINERRLLEHLQLHGPSSRAGLKRISGLTAPTVSKVVDALLDQGLLEEVEPTEPSLGRPGKLVRLAQRSAVVLGVLLDAGRCTVAVAGLDGRIDAARTRRIETPEAYADLLDVIERECREVLAGLGGTPQGIAVVVNGLIHAAEQRVMCCVNLHILDGREPGRDLAERLGFRCWLLKGTSALCLSERAAGGLVDRDNFAVLDMTTGLGLGVISGGAVLAGHSGMAGEIGHVVVDPGGTLCGCGNRGCLETLATDAAAVRLVSEKVGRQVSRDEACSLLGGRPAEFADVVEKLARHLAMAAAMVVTIFNPGTLLIHSELFLDTGERLGDVAAWLARTGLAASVADCTLARTRSTKEQAAIAAIIHEITQTWAPALR